MLLTEEDARQKWCPYVHLDRSIEQPEGAHENCMASGCMQWRWAVHYTDDYYQLGTEAFCRSKIEDSRAPYEGCELRGYCGLSGRP